MTRSSRANDLREELQRLFEQNFSEREAYNQVKDDDRFDSVRLAKVSTIFKQFEAEKDKKFKRKKPIDPQLTKLIHKSEQLAYFRSTLECDHKNNYRFLKRWNGSSSDGRFFTTFDQTWDIDDGRNFILKDVFSNKECRTEIPISLPAEQCEFWPLTYDTGLLIEYMDRDHEGDFSGFSLTLLELDWAEKEIRKVHTITIEDQQRRFSFYKIIVDVMNTTRFILSSLRDDGSITLKVGYVRNSQILLREEILLENQDIHLGFLSLIENTFYIFDDWEFARSNEAKMLVTCLDQGAETSEVILDSVPEQLSTVKGEFRGCVGCLAMERIYLAVQHKKTKHYGIIWTDCNTRKWELVDFCIKEPITRVQFMAEGHFLWIHTVEKVTESISDVHQVQKALYRIPLKKPEKLYDLAWFSLIRSKSKLKGVDPYKEAQKYLPLYSEIRCPFED